MKRYGIFGGTFNPPHLAHSIIAEDIRQQFSLDKILFVPSVNPPLKNDSSVISYSHRLAMAGLAFDSDKHFEICDIEISDNNRKSYTVDTLLKLKELYKADNIKLYLILGIDAVIDFHGWKNPEKLFLMSEVVVVNRPDFRVEDIKPEYASKLNFAKVPFLEISSTMIREYVKNGKSIKYLVHLDVENYIFKNKLYI